MLVFECDVTVEFSHVIIFIEVLIFCYENFADI